MEGENADPGFLCQDQTSSASEFDNQNLNNGGIQIGKDNTTSEQSEPNSIENYGSREASDDENEYNEQDEISQTTPFELTLQSILGNPLDTTVWHLRGLYDSQVALTTQLNLLMSTLESYRASTRPVKLKETIVQIKESKRRLHAINTTLSMVEARILRVKERLVAVQAPEPTPPRRTLG